MSFPDFYDRNNNEYYSKEGNQFITKGRIVNIKNNIPRFVESGSYATLFGDQWKTYKKTQLDSYTGQPISETRLNRCLGELSTNLNNKLVLEAGCGAGRFTEILLRKGAKLMCTDLSSAIDVNSENFLISNTHQLIQADINDLPFVDNQFDIVICLGVVQHTPSPEETIKNLYHMVKPGGYLIFDHYCFSRSALFRSASIYRFWLKRKSPKTTLAFTKKIVKKYLPLHKRFSKYKLLSILLNRISPVITYFNIYPELNYKLQEEWALLDTHDSLTDWNKKFRNKTQILKILNSLGATEIWCDYGGNGVEARLKKPM